MAKYGKAAAKKVKRAMHKRKKGTLKSGRSGKTVKSKKQAVAIALSEARESGAKVPRKSSRKKSAGGRSASRKSPSRKSSARKSSSRKSTARKSSSRSSSTRKSTGRKSTSRKTSASKK